jgi:membrane associated rhomboid family serine protease
LADSRYRLDDEEGALQSWIVATQAPENPLSWKAWVALAGARVRQGDINGAARCYREAERRAPPDERPQIASRLGWLNKEMGNPGQAQRYFSRSRVGVFTPLATYGLIAVTVLVSVAAMVSPDLVAALELNKQLLREGEWWRLLSVTLVHDTSTPLHLLFNMYALFIVGPIVEALYGRVLFLVFYALAGAMGSVASYLFLPNPSVGASGAIFGLFGVVAASTFIHKPALGRQARALTSQIVILIVINLAIGFGIGGFLGATIDNYAHIGGLIAGLWLGFAIAPRGLATLSSFWRAPDSPIATPTDPRLRGLAQVGAMVAVLVVVLIALSITPFWAGAAT